jgi:sporulation protein YlmC with PRC-barrel domain
MDALVSNLEQKSDQKLEGFKVLDPEGRSLGEVQEVILGPDRVLHLAIRQPQSEAGASAFLLSSKFVQAIDPHTQSLTVGLSREDVLALPKYAEETATHPTLKVSSEPSSVTEAVIRLLEERLVVSAQKRKVGEVTVRKVVETRIVEVPVRREKLIVEQISPERKPLVEVDLGEQADGTIELIESGSTQSTQTVRETTVRGEFTSLRTASQLLDAIALQAPQGCLKIRLELVLENPQDQATYQAWFDRVGQNLS